MKHHYLKYTSTAGNSYVMNLDDVRCVKSRNKDTNLTVVTTCGKEYDAVEGNLPICKQVLEEYTKWLDLIGTEGDKNSFDFTYYHNRFKEAYVSSILSD